MPLCSARSGPGYSQTRSATLPPGPTPRTIAAKGNCFLNIVGKEEIMKLGDYVQISTTVSDLAVALAFYEKLGFKQVANAVVTDGSLNILLLTGNSPSPALSYAGSDIEQIKALGIPLEGDDD